MRIPSTIFKLVCIFGLSDRVITPLSPTLSNASAISSPVSSLPLETLAICFIAVLSSIFKTSDFIFSITKSTAFFIPTRSIIGFAPAVKYFKPSLKIFCAKIVAVVVPSPAISLVFIDASFIIDAPKFSIGSSKAISFAIVTPSLVISGLSYGLSITTFLPFGPSVIFTASQSTFAPFNILLRADSLNSIILLICNHSYNVDLT